MARHFRVVLASAVVAILVVGAVMPAAAQGTIRYVATTGTDNSTCAVDAPCKTIQHAIDVAQAGDTINVAGGMYAELVTIDKANITLEAQTRHGAVIKPPAERTDSPYGAVLITGDGAKIDGFEIDGTTVCRNGINAYGASDVTIVNNVVYDATATAASDGVGIIVGSWDAETIDNAHIENNEVYVTDRMGIFVMDYSGSQYEVTSGNVIRGNTVRHTWLAVGAKDHGGAIQINVGQNSSIVNNVIYNTQGDNWGIYMFGSASGNTISGNALSRNRRGIGLWISGLPDGEPIDWEDDAAVSPTVVFNTISGDTVALESFGDRESDVVNASGNWWGSDTGPYNQSSNPDGTGDSVSDNVDYYPWLGAEAASDALSRGESVSLVTEEGQPAEVLATYTGAGTVDVTLAKYAVNPGVDVPGVIGAGDAFYDVQATVTDPAAKLTVVIAAGVQAAGKPLYWYDGSAWKQVRGLNGEPVLTDAEGRYTFTLGSSSSPTLSQLTGTVFGAGSGPQIRVQPAGYDLLVPGDEIDVSIAAKASDLYGAELQLTWNAAQLETSADDIALGPFLSPDTVTKKEVSADGTTAMIAFTQNDPPHSAGVSGGGVLATIRFTVKSGASAGDKALDLKNVKLFDSAGLEIPVAEADILDDVITVTAASNPEPSITAISPDSATAGSGSLLLTIDGEGFVPQSVVRWKDEIALTTMFVNSGRVVALVPASSLATAGTASVTVFNPAPGGGESNALTFTITSAETPNPKPSITAISPSATTAGSGAFLLTVDGTGFVPGSTAKWNGEELTTLFVKDTKVVALVPESLVATAGTASVTVFNPAPGGGESDPVTFTISPVVQPPVGQRMYLPQVAQ